MNTEKLFVIAAKVRFPLTLAGVVVIVLYALYRQLLNLGVFDNIGGQSTFALLTNIVDRLFWLALVAIVLGIFSYIFTTFLSSRKTSSNDKSLFQYNALKLGYYIGYYFFMLATTGNNPEEELQPQEIEVLQVIMSKINELVRFFQIEKELKFPASPSEARSLFGCIENQEVSIFGSNFYDILEVRYGQEISQLYALGKMLMTYPLLAKRNEPEIGPAKERMINDIVSISQKLCIENRTIRMLLNNPNQLFDVGSTIEIVMEAKQ